MFKCINQFIKTVIIIINNSWLLNFLQQLLFVVASMISLLLFSCLQQRLKKFKQQPSGLDICHCQTSGFHLNISHVHLNSCCELTNSKTNNKTKPFQQFITELKKSIQHHRLCDVLPLLLSHLTSGTLFYFQVCNYSQRRQITIQSLFHLIHPNIWTWTQAPAFLCSPCVPSWSSRPALW